MHEVSTKLSFRFKIYELLEISLSTFPGTFDASMIVNLLDECELHGPPKRMNFNAASTLPKRGDTPKSEDMVTLCRIRGFGGLGEWFKPAVLKTAEGVILP